MANRKLLTLKRSPSNVIFDLDGTLVDSVAGIEMSLSAAFLSIGRQMPDVSLRKIIGPPIGTIARHLEPSLSDHEAAEVVDRYRSSYDAFGWRQTVPFDGVAETLHALKQRQVRLFIVTNKPKLPTERILAQLELLNLFQDVLSRDSRDPAYSSKTEMLFELLEDHGLEALSTCMVGDTIEDGEAAAANQLQFIHARYGYGAMDTCPQYIDSFSELSTLLD